MPGPLRSGATLALFLLLHAGVHAQDARGPLLLELPAGTRALALGNSFPAGQTDSDGLFYAPALHDRLRGASVAIQSFGGAGTLLSASAAMEWWSGALAVGVRTLSYTGFAAAGDEAALLSESGTTLSERVASLGYARSVRGIRVGTVAHVIEQRSAARTGTGMAVDVGVGAQPFGIAAALTARSLGPDFQLESRTPLPASVLLAVGAPSSIGAGPFDLVPAARVEYRFDDGFRGGAGLEASYWPVPGRTFTLRLGARSVEDGVQPWTAGAAFAGDRIIVDYAFVPYDDGVTGHRLGVRWR